MYSIRMINTFNESSLHRELKNTFCKACKGKTEQKVEEYICDIICEDGAIIEIQTKNLGNLTGKILNLLQTHSVTLVYPLAITTYIEYYDEKALDQKPLSRRKSPKKKNLYDAFDELMGCFPILLHKRFTLKILEVSITKERIKTKEKVQSPNKKRRFLKDWVLHDTTLDESYNTYTFNTKNDYLQLLPQSLSTCFSVSDVSSSGSLSKQQAYKMIWTLTKMNLIKLVEKRRNTKFYTVL